MLCPLSALHHFGGPERLINYEDLGPVLDAMANEILSYNVVSLGLQDLKDILECALRFALPPQEYITKHEFAPKLPDGISDWEYFDPVGIGYFDEYDPEQYGPVQINRRYRNGSGVQVLRPEDYCGNGRFYCIIIEEDGVERLEEKVTCYGFRRGRNFFVMRGCLAYLRVWLDPTLPPRIAFKDSAPTMMLEGELYEILNSHHEDRDRDGLLPSFKYGEVSKTFDDNDYRFLLARRDSRHTSEAISMGLRGEKLLPALYADFRCWQSMRPDIWPSPSEEPSSCTILTNFSRFKSSSNLLNSLPVELVFEILRQLPIPSILALSSTSHSLRKLIIDPDFLNQVIKTAVLSGTEFWVLPVDGVPGEKGRAWETAAKWITSQSAGAQDKAEIAESPFLSPGFPYIRFLRACYASDSMRNRQRLWRIVKQFDVLWRDYRLNGWQRDDILLAH